MKVFRCHSLPWEYKGSCPFVWRKQNGFPQHCHTSRLSCGLHWLHFVPCSFILCSLPCHNLGYRMPLPSPAWIACLMNLRQDGRWKSVAILQSVSTAREWGQWNTTRAIKHINHIWMLGFSPTPPPSTLLHVSPTCSYVRELALNLKRAYLGLRLNMFPYFHWCFLFGLDLLTGLLLQNSWMKVNKAITQNILCSNLL